MRLAFLLLLLAANACSSPPASPNDQGDLSDPLRFPDGGCPGCTRGGICLLGQVDSACGSSGECVDCRTALGPCAIGTCEYPASQGADRCATSIAVNGCDAGS